MRHSGSRKAGFQGKWSWKLHTTSFTLQLGVVVVVVVVVGAVVVVDAVVVVVVLVLMVS